MKSKQLLKNIDRPLPDNSKRKEIYRFDRNERTTLFNKKQFSDIINNINSFDLVAYAELEPFYKKISEYLNVSREEVLLTSGSDMAIRSIFETFIDIGDKVIVTQPNYAMFSVYNKMYGGVEISHFYEENLHLDVNELINKIDKNIKLIIISNPSHTGKCISDKDLVKIIDKANEFDSIVIVDEAYYGFYKNSILNKINKYKNLIVIRTFSKAFGLASLRVGVLISNNKIISELYKVKLVHEITGVAAKIGSYLLDNLYIVEEYIKEVNNGKNILYNRLNNLNIRTYKSDSNFIFFKLQNNYSSSDLMLFLEKNNIYIKGPFNKYPFNNQFRITVGDVKQMNMFCDQIELFLNQN